jgi:hypothetical protein
MARHLHVVSVQNEGRRLSRWSAGDGASAPADPPEIPEGFRLIAVVNNGDWQSAIDVTHPSYFARIRRRCAERVWTEMALYLVDEERAGQIEDGRRIQMNGMPVRDSTPPRNRAMR